MSTTPGEAEKKSRKMASQVPDAGKEYQAYQEGQAELMGIEAQRKQLLMEQQIQNRSTAEKNAIVAQAAELGAMSAVQGGNGPVVAQQVSKMNPQTQAMLSKYGVGQPKVQLQQGRDVKVTPNHINITNNNVQKTTNNVTVQGNPAGSAPVVMKSAGGDNGGTGTMAKFKTWMSNVFNRQKEEASIREKEYQRKEWSLSRSSGRVMRSLEKLGKTIGERLDPRKLASSNFSTMKALMWMVGLNRLVEWWPTILGFADKAEGWFDDAKRFFGFDLGENEQSGLTKTIVSLFGGSSGEKAGEAFKKFWWNPTGEGGDGIFNLLLAELKHLFNFDLRAKAAADVKFPTMDTSGFTGDLLSPLMSGLGGLVSNLGTYIKDVLTAFFTGKTPPPAETLEPIKESALESATDKGSSYANSSAKGLKDTIKDKENKHLKDTSYGDASGVRTGNNRQNWLDKSDIQDDGSLKDNLGSSLRQGNQITSLISDGSNAHTAKIIEGFSRLEDKVNNAGSTVVPLDFFDSLEKLGLDSEKYKSLAQQQNFKLISARNTDWYSWGDIGSNYLQGLAAAGKTAQGIANPLSTYSPLINAGKALGHAVNVGKGIYSKFTENENILRLVPESFEGDAVEFDGKKSFPLYVLDHNVLSEIKKDLAQKGNLDTFEFSLKDTESTEALNNILQTSKGDGVIVPNDDLSKDYHEHHQKVQSQIAKRKADREELNQRWENSRPAKSAEYVGEKISSGVNAVKGAVTSAGEWISENFGDSLPNWAKRILPGNISGSNSDPRSAVVKEAAKWSGDEGKRGTGKLMYSNSVRDNKRGSNDCSGFVSQVYADSLGISIPAQSASLFTSNIGTIVDKSNIDSSGNGTPKSPDLNKIKPGDVMFYTRQSGNYNGGYGIGHVAMYVGNGYELSQGDDGGPYLVKSQASSRYGKYVGAKSIINDGTSVPADSTSNNPVISSSNTGSDDSGEYSAFTDVNEAGVSKAGMRFLLGNEGWSDGNSNKGYGTVGTDAKVTKVKNRVVVGPGLTDSINSVPGIAKKVVEGETWTADEIKQTYEAVIKHNMDTLKSLGASAEKYGQGGMDALAYLSHWKPAVAQNAVKNTKNAEELADWIEQNVDMSKEGPGGSDAVRAMVAIIRGTDISGSTRFDNYKGTGSNYDKLNAWLGTSTTSYSSSGGKSSGKGFFSGIFDTVRTAASNLWNGVKEGIENIGSSTEAKYSNVGFDESLRRAKELSKKLGISLPGEDPDSVVEFLDKYDKDFNWQLRKDDNGNRTMWAQVSHIGRILDGDEEYEDYKTLLEYGIDPGREKYEEREKKRKKKLNNNIDIKEPDSIEEDDKIYYGGELNEVVVTAKSPSKPKDDNNQTPSTSTEEKKDNKKLYSKEDLESEGWSNSDGYLVTKNTKDLAGNVKTVNVPEELEKLSSEEEKLKWLEEFYRGVKFEYKDTPEGRILVSRKKTTQEGAADFRKGLGDKYQIQKFSVDEGLQTKPQFSKDQWTNDFLTKSLEDYENSLNEKKSEKDILGEQLNNLKDIKSGINTLSGGIYDLARIVKGSGNSIINVSQSGGPTVHTPLT